MDANVIERLLIDRSLGELSPDVEALLQAHLDSHPGDARLAKEIGDTIARAREALRGAGTEATIALPPAPFAGADFAEGRRASWRAWARRLSAAALIALAFWLGGRGTPAVPQPGPNGEGNAFHEQRAPRAPASGFWSATRLRESVAGRRSAHPVRIKWPGPMTRPRIGESS